MPVPAIIGSATQLITKDINASTSWYRQKMGFDLIRFVGEPPVYAMLQRDGFQLHLAKTTTGHVPLNRDANSISHDIIFWVPEIDAFHHELMERGANFLQPIMLKPYGNREFVVEDFDGHRILICD